VRSLYVETSAVLTWLLGQTHADDVRARVDAAEVVMTSSLTFAETERAVVRAESERLIRAADGQRLRGLLQRASSGWMRMTVSEDILARAGRPFPVEPVRTLDAIHLATALAFTRAFSDLQLLSFDRRLLDNARALGIG
jgi:predicted nucleic acid-binding protein